MENSSENRKQVEKIILDIGELLIQTALVDFSASSFTLSDQSNSFATDPDTPLARNHDAIHA